MATRILAWMRRGTGVGVGVMVLVFALLAQVPQALAGDGLGRLSFVRVPTTPLRQTYASTAQFRMKVGGIAFSDMAVGVDGLAVEALRYDGSRPDGERLRVQMRCQDGRVEEVTAPVHDWIFVPVARYAASDHNACVTIFGDRDSLEVDARTASGQEAVASASRPGARIIQYHQEFQNELLGLRLLHADIMLLTEEAAELFKHGESHILGAGEQRPDISQNKSRYQTVRRWLDEQQDGSTVFFSEQWRATQNGRHTKAWTFTAEAAYEYSFEGVSAEKKDIDFRLLLDGRQIDDDLLTDHFPIVEASGVRGELRLELILPSDAKEGDVVELKGTRRRLENRPEQTFTSYVITDPRKGQHDARIEFRVERGMLMFTGSPYWELWDWTAAARTRQDEQVSVAYMEVVKEMEGWLDARAARDPDAYAALVVVLWLDSEGTDTRDLLNRLRRNLAPADRERLGIPAAGAGGAAEDVLMRVVSQAGQALEKAPGRAEALATAFAEELETRALALSDRIESERELRDGDIIVRRELSQTLSERIRENDGINPAVYEALTKTMHYAALFRHYRGRDADGYAAFVRSLDGVSTAPASPEGLSDVATPGIWLPER